MPVELSTYAEYGKLEEFEKHYGLECVNCGSCSFTCPAKRPLAQRINQARMTVLANKKKAASANKK
jgi:electron transport complex protein RnfC